MPQNLNQKNLNLLKFADDCLIEMETKANELKLSGFAVIAVLNDNNNENWTSKMKVCGALKNDTVNFLSVAYSKAGEMMDTFQNSGTTEQIPLLGEFGFFFQAQSPLKEP